MSPVVSVMKFRCVTLCNVMLRYVISRQIKIITFERGNVNAKRMRDLCSCYPKTVIVYHHSQVSAVD